MKFLKSNSFRGGVIQSIILNVFSKGITFLNTVLITFYFGVTLQTDIYYYIFAIVAIVAGYITVINSAVLIPEAMRLKENVSKEAAMIYINRYAIWHFLIGIAVSILILIFPEFIFSGISKFSFDSLHAHKDIIVLLVLLLPLIIISQHLKDILSMYNYFSISIILSIINSICSIIFLISFSTSKNLAFAVWGLLFGYLINLFLQFYIVIRKVGWKFTIGNFWFGDRAGMAHLWYISNLISLPIGNIYLFIIPLLGDGYLSAYSLALQISLIPVQFISLQMISVIAIKFNELHSKSDFLNIGKLFSDATDLTLFIMTSMAALLFLNSTEFVTIIFKRGNFNSQAVELTSYFLKFLSISIPFGVLANFTSVLLMASQQIKKAFYYQITANVSMVIISITGFYFWQMKGFLIGIIVYNILNNIAMQILFSNDTYIKYSTALRQLMIYLLLCGTFIWVTGFIENFIHHYNDFYKVFIKTLFFCITLIVSIYLFGVNRNLFVELNKLILIIERKKNKK